MLSDEANIIEETLSKILNEPIRNIRRAAATGMIDFGQDKISKDSHGRERILTQYALHLQCAFRIIDSDKVIVANLDMFEPNSKTKWSENFDWDVFGANLYDEKCQLLVRELEDTSIIVTAVKASCFGDLKIFLSNGYVIEVMNNLSCNEEIWRFFEPGTENAHFVFTGCGIEP